MKTELIQSLTGTFEAHAQQTESGTKHCLVQDRRRQLRYSQRTKFLNVFSNAETAREIEGHDV